MKSKAILALLVLPFLFLTNQNYAQVKGTSKMFLQNQMRNISFQDASLNSTNFFKKEANKMGLTSATEMQFTKSFEGENGYQHFRYQQIYQSIPVFGAAYTIHQKDNIVTHASGYYLPLINLEVTPKLKEDVAIQVAMDKMGAKVYAFENNEKRTVGFSPNLPTAELVIIDRAYPQSSEYYALAYQVVLSSEEPLDKRQYFVDANTGRVILDLPLLMHNAIPTQGKTKYYGTQSIIVDSLGPNNFLLRDPTRNGNTTFNGQREIWSNETNSWNLTNVDQDEVAIDAHYCTQEFHDFMLEKLNWNGLDNEGLPMKIVVHAGDFVNAFWNGEFAAFGDGDCNHGPLTTLEVVAHEFMHGVTDNTSQLIYSGESGAINESMSDIFGQALEFYTTPDEFNWDLGSSFIVSPYAESFRSFENPNNREHPKFYKGLFWEDGGGVHTNSSVGNHWFYQLVNGGSGINEIGESYNIEPLGMDKAIQIAFLIQKAYLIPNSNYDFFYESSLLATQELFGENAPEIQSVIEAWKVVGLPFDGGSNGEFLDLSVSFSDPFNSVCLNNQWYSTEVTVSNIGTLPYLAIMNATLSANGGSAGNNQEVNLTEDIAPGESMVFQFNDIVFFDRDITQTISADVDIFDVNSQNDFDFQFVNNSIYIENDLKIFPPQFSEINCYNNVFDLTFTVQNNSCNPIPEGTSFEVQLTNSVSGFFWSSIQTLTTDLQRDGSFQFVEELDLEPSKDYSVNLVFDNDVNINNNSRSVSYPSFNPIVETYDNTMESGDSFLKIKGFFPIDYLDYEQNSVLAISSFFDEQSADLCLEAGENIENNIFGRAAKLFVCADLNNFENISLEFDLIQFRQGNGIVFPELEDNSTVFKASWITEDDSFEQIIIGQPEGTSVHYDFPLPEKFKGKIEFDFFHNQGDIYSSNYFENDVSLFDNLTIKGDSTNNKFIEDTTFEVFPNPSTGLITIKHPEAPKNLVMYNSLGQLILTTNRFEEMCELNLSEFPNSYYFITISYEDLGKITKGLVKISD